MRDHLLASWRVMWKGAALFLLCSIICVVVMGLLFGTISLIGWVSGANEDVVGTIIISAFFVVLIASMVIPMFKLELRSIRRKKDSR